MAKIYGLFGSMTGKLADVVMSVRNGEQIARKYQPVVFNPSTIAQVAVRARMKLMSQLSAICAPVIAIPRQGSASSRNIFTKKNFQLSSFSTTDSKADIALDQIQLTDSVVALPAVGVNRDSEGVNTSLVFPAGGIGGLDIDRVVYCLFEKQEDEKLRFVTSAVVSEAGSGTFGTTFSGTFPTGAVVLAYGVRDNNNVAKARFENIEVPTAATVAQLIVTRTLTETDVTLTETRGAILAAVSNRDAETEQKKGKSSK